MFRRLAYHEEMVWVNLLLSLASIFVIWVSVSFLRDAAKVGIPFVPSNRSKMKRMIDLAGAQPGERAVDLGSGDGRFIIELAKRGSEAHGYELIHTLVYWSNFLIWLKGIKGRAFAHYQNFWEISFKGFDIVTIYCLPSQMAKLEEKLLKELKPGARVVVNRFKFPNWQPSVTEGDIFLYKKEA